MLVYRPQDKVKVMVLVPSVIAVLFYFIFFVLPMMARMRQDASPAATPVDSTNSTTKTTPDASVAPTTPTSPLTADAGVPQEIMNDPFKPPTSVTAAGPGINIVGIQGKPISPVPPAPVGDLSVSQDSGKGPVISPAVVAPAAQAPEITLQGVVLADHAVGVFRTGDQTFYKHVGDVVVADIILKLVSDNGVVLSKGKKLYTLEIGHSDLSPTTKLAPPVFPTMTRSAAMIDKAAVAYRATEASAGLSVGSDVRAQQPTNLTSAPKAEIVAGSAPTHIIQSAKPVSPSSGNSRPAVQATDTTNKGSDKIVVYSANLISDPSHVVSVPADGLSPEIHQASMLVHKKTRGRHKRRRVRHAHGMHRHRARKHRRARPRNHIQSFMS